jgi:hypothetical protein
MMEASAALTGQLIGTVTERLSKTVTTHFAVSANHNALVRLLCNASGRFSGRQGWCYKVGYLTPLPIIDQTRGSTG